jgi:DNA-binding GntR family transcriptional regulator
VSCGHTHRIPLPVAGGQSQTARLADELAMDIHLGAIKPGAPLREVELAESHGVSRTIVRAALQRLESQGLVEIVLNKGARVRAVSLASLSDMLDLHADLTALAARHAALRASPEHLAALRAIVEMMDHVAEDGGPPQDFQHLRIGFAMALYEAAGPVLAERLRSAAPVVPHHEQAMDDIRDAAGQATAARLARDVAVAVARRDAGLAGCAAEKLVRGEALPKAAPTPARVSRRTKSAA